MYEPEIGDIVNVFSEEDTLRGTIIAYDETKRLVTILSYYQTPKNKKDIKNKKKNKSGTAFIKKIRSEVITTRKFINISKNGLQKNKKNKLAWQRTWQQKWSED